MAKSIKQKNKQIGIDTDIPLPKNAKNIDAKYPFAGMKVKRKSDGLPDSFFVPNISPNSLRVTASNWKKKAGKKKWKFLTSEWKEPGKKGKKGTRIWRVK